MNVQLVKSLLKWKIDIWMTNGGQPPYSFTLTAFERKQIKLHSRICSQIYHFGVVVGQSFTIHMQINCYQNPSPSFEMTSENNKVSTRCPNCPICAFVVCLQMHSLLLHCIARQEQKIERKIKTLTKITEEKPINFDFLYLYIVLSCVCTVYDDI